MKTLFYNYYIDRDKKYKSEFAYLYMSSSPKFYEFLRVSVQGKCVLNMDFKVTSDEIRKLGRKNSCIPGFLIKISVQGDSAYY